MRGNLGDVKPVGEGVWEMREFFGDRDAWRRKQVHTVCRYCKSYCYGEGAKDMSANTIKTRPFDMANYLGSEDDVAEYLGQVLAEGDPAELAAALGDIARARGMTQLARDTGLSRESLYKSLSGERAPSTDTLFKVMKALGFELKVQLAKDGA